MPEIIYANVVEPYFYPIAAIVSCGPKIARVASQERRGGGPVAVLEVIHSPTDDDREAADSWLRSCLGLK